MWGNPRRNSEALPVATIPPTPRTHGYVFNRLFSATVLRFAVRRGLKLVTNISVRKPNATSGLRSHCRYNRCPQEVPKAPKVRTRRVYLRPSLSSKSVALAATQYPTTQTVRMLGSVMLWLISMTFVILTISLM